MQYWLIFGIILMSGSALAKRDLESQFCLLKQNTTAQIRMELKLYEDLETLPQQLVWRTQSFEYNDQSVRLNYFEMNNKIGVNEIRSDLTVYQYFDNSISMLAFIDARNEYIIARSFNLTLQKSDYQLFKVNLGTTDDHTQFIISGTQDLNNNQIGHFNLSKLLYIDQTKMYVVMTDQSSTHLYSINLQEEENMQKVATISLSRKLNIAAGNSKIMFDSGCGLFYVKKDDPTSTEYEAKTISDLNLSDYLSSTVQFFELDRGNMVAFSNDGQKIGIVLIDSDGNILPDSTTIKIGERGLSFTITDNYKNAFFSSQQDFVWVKIESDGMHLYQLSKSQPQEQVKQKLQYIVQSYVPFAGFNKEFMTLALITQNSFYQLSIVNLKYDSVKKQVTVEDEYYKTFQLAKAAEVLIGAELGYYNFHYTCNCVSDVLDRFECFENELKCVGVTRIERQNCSLAPIPLGG